MNNLLKILTATVVIIEAAGKVAEALDDKPNNSRGRNRNNGRGNHNNNKHYNKRYR